MANNFDQLAKDIIDHIGGEENVENLRHCITRLRFNLKDESLADTTYLKNREGIVTVVQSGGQYQVVIGDNVADVYKAIMDQYPIGSTSSPSEEEDKSDKNILDRFIDFISSVFQPFLMGLAATGLIKGIIAVLSAFGVSHDSGLYQVLNFAGDGFFKFLPIMVALTTSRKLGMKDFSALAIVMALVHPDFMNLGSGEVLYTLFEGTAFESPIYNTLMGIPIIIPEAGYYSSIIPAIIAVLFGSKIEKWAKKWVPKTISSFIVPFITIIISVPISVLVIGPLASWASSLIGFLFTQLYEFNSVIFAILLGALWQLLVIFGLHWGIVPIRFLLLAENGWEPIGALGALSTFGMLGVVLALLVKSKNKKIRDIGIPGSISLFFGISEPVVYGLMIPMKKSFLITIIANGIAGAYNGFFNVVNYQTGGLGIFSLLRGINPEEGITMNVIHMAISFVIATAVGFILQMIVPLDEGTLSDKSTVKEKNSEIKEIDENLNEDSGLRHKDILASPLAGKVIPLEEVPDEVFSSGVMGKGLAIEPVEGRLIAPANGVVSTIFETGHAIGITTDQGTEVLIHIGINTVEMNGEGFIKEVAQGDRIEAGQTLIRFDIEKIKAAGFSPTTIIVVVNSDDLTDVLMTQEEKIEYSDYLITAIN